MPVRIFQTKPVARFAKSERISDASLIEAVERANRGLVDADLGGGLIKQRVARVGQGRSGGYRMLIAIRERERAVFVFGFAKSDLDNIGDNQLATLKEIAAIWLAADDDMLERAMANGILIEVRNGG
ncbi:MAG: type II toxin-antitoxin system RelE/ParE family toxin [Beijerinckiaceae bacterium]